MNGSHEQTGTSTTIGNSPLGAAIMFIGVTIVVIGLLYKPEKAKTLEIISPQ